MTMNSHYWLPTLAQYALNRQRAEYEYRGGPSCSPIKIIKEYSPSRRPLEDASLLEDHLFRSYLDTNAEYWNFISDQSAVEKSQLQILLAQLSARHGISSEIRANIGYREIQAGSHLAEAESGAFGYGDPLGLKLGLERRLDDLSRERNMESVALWRDSQKLLGDLFRHWTAYTNLARRSRVIDGEL